MEQPEMMPQSNRTLKQILEHPATMATVLHAIGVKTFGTEYYSWEPETILMEFEEQFSCKLPIENLHKILAIAYLQTSDVAYNDWVAFITTVNSLNGDDNPMEFTDVATPAELAWAVTEMHLNDSTFKVPSMPIRKFTGVSLDDSGIVVPPPVLSWAVMPKKYQGSDFGPDMGQQQAFSNDHQELVDEYIKSQAHLLFRQICGLPWMTEDQIQAVKNSIAGIESEVPKV